MELKLSVSNDTELRAFVKDLIRGNVTAVGRDEIKQIIVEEFERKSIKGNFINEKAIEKALDRFVEKIHQTIDPSWGNKLNKKIEDRLEYLLEKRMKETDINKLIDTATKKRVNSLVEKLNVLNDANDK